MHRALMLSVALALLTGASAAAADLEPAVGVRLSFDGQGLRPLRLGLRLDYAGHGGLAGEGAQRLPAALEWAVEGAGSVTLYTAGLPVASGPRLRLSQMQLGEPEEGSEVEEIEEIDEAEDSAQDDGWSWNTGTLALAAAGGLALLLASSDSETRSGSNDTGGPDGNGNGGIGCVNGDCLVPLPECGTTGPVFGCGEDFLPARGPLARR